MEPDRLLDDPLVADVVEKIADHLGARAQMRAARTQVAWKRRRTFLLVWTARRWLGPSAAPVVITVVLPDPVDSPRWKQVNQVRPGQWNHHVEVQALTQVDDEVLRWIDLAWESAC